MVPIKGNTNKLEKQSISTKTDSTKLQAEVRQSSTKQASKQPGYKNQNQA